MLYIIACITPTAKSDIYCRPKALKLGDKVESGMICEPKVGNAMPLEAIPGGLEVHNIEMTAGQGGKIVRVAGSAARIVAKEGDWVTLASAER